MADELDAIEEARRQAELAAQQTAQSAPVVTAASRASDYTQRGLPTGNEYAPGVSTANLPPMGAPPQSFDLNNPQPGIPTTTGNQGQLSPQEQAFWAANPNGAVKDPQTGNLVGLGTVAPPPPPIGPDGMVTVNAGLGPPSTPYNQQTRINTGLGPPAIPNQVQQEVPDFVHIPEVNPVLIAQRQQIQNEIATTQNQLRSASSQRSRGQPSQREILTQKLGTLTDANNGLGQEHYRQSEAQRKATDQNSELQNKYMNDQASMAIMGGLNQIKSTPGSDQYHADVIALRQQIGQQFPGSTLDNRNRALFEKAATAHNHEAEFLARAKAENKNVELTGYHEGQATYKTTDPNAVPTNVQTRYARLQGNIQDHTEQAAAQQAVDTKAHKANNPYANASQLHADQTEARLLTDKYPGLKAVAPETTTKIRKYNPQTGQLE